MKTQQVVDKMLIKAKQISIGTAASVEAVFKESEKMQCVGIIWKWQDGAGKDHDFGQMMPLDCAEYYCTRNIHSDPYFIGVKGLFLDEYFKTTTEQTP